MIAATILACCTIIAGFLFYLNIRSTVNRPFAERFFGAISPTPEANSGIDTDADGLTDGEETGLGTNPMDADTDDDGYLDGEEVAQDTDPLNADKMPAVESIRSLLGQNGGSLSRALAESVLNDIAANDRLFWTESPTSEQVTLHVAYAAEDTDELSGMLSETLLSRDDVAAIRAIPDSDLRISPDNGPEAVGKYLERLNGAISNGAATKELESFYDQVSAQLSTESPAINQRTKQLAQNTIVPLLSDIEQKLRVMDVPSTWKELHKDQIALIAGQRLGISYLVGETGDPLRAYYGIALLQKVNDDSQAWKERAKELLNA